jgi:hypothetical protein
MTIISFLLLYGYFLYCTKFPFKGKLAISLKIYSFCVKIRYYGDNGEEIMALLFIFYILVCFSFRRYAILGDEILV